MRHLRCLSLAILVTVGGCGGGGSPAAETPRPQAPGAQTEARVVSTRIGDQVAAPPVAAEVAGAASVPAEQDVPADIVALSSRMNPRALPIPPTRNGMSGRFVFDGRKRGWFARVPGSNQALLTPAYGGGKVFLGGGFGSSQFFAYNARSGQPLWTASAPDGGPTAAIVEDDRVLFNTESCTLFAINAFSGEHLWRRWLGDPLMGQPASDGGMVYSGHVIDGRSPGRLRRGTTGWGVAGGRRYGFTAMRARDGRPRWTRAISADVMNGPVLDGDSVFFTTMDGGVYRLNRRNGRTRWHRNLRATSAPWLFDGRVHVTARAGEQRERTLVLSRNNGATVDEMDAVDAGFLRERADSGGVRNGWAYEGSRPTIVDGRMYQTIGNEVHCRNAQSGDLLWRRQYTDNTSSRPASPPAVAGGQLVFGTNEGDLFALDVDTGMTTWAYRVGEPIGAQPSIAHGWVYASTTRGGLLGIEVADPSFDGWHMWGGSASHNGPTLGTAPPPEDDSRPSEGTLALGDEPMEGELAGFPIQSTQVSARVSGFVARVRVEQVFDNPYSRPVRASYLFPVPEGATISGMEMHAGPRVVRARVAPRPAPGAAPDVAPRDAAGEISATVLEQERPDLFRQTVRAVRPTEQIRVVLEYTQILPYSSGSYRFQYPLRAGSRYERATGADGINPAGTPLERELSGSDVRPDEVEVEIETDLGLAADISSSTHQLDVGRRDVRRRRVRLESEARPDRDLDVRLAVGEEQPAVALVASPPSGEEAGYLALALHPRLSLGQDEVMPREVVIVLDRSSSMRGPAMEIARAVARRALAGLGPRDTFRILTLDGESIGGRGTEAMAAREENVQAAERAIGRVTLRATGSRRGLTTALATPTDDERLRVVLLASDGYLGNETEVFGEVRASIGHSRLFALGVGTAVNEYLLTRLTELGRGELSVPRLSDSPDEISERFHRRFARPYLTDLSISFEGVRVADLYPRRLPDVFDDHPVVMHGRFAAGGRGRATVRGRVAGRLFEQIIEITLPESGPARPELESIWARSRIQDLLTATALTPNPEHRQEIVRLAVQHQVLTPYTTFVAVDPGDPRQVPADTSPSERPRSSGRPDRNASSHIGPCYESSRDPDGEIDQEALADCLASHSE